MIYICSIPPLKERRNRSHSTHNLHIIPSYTPSSRVRCEYFPTWIEMPKLSFNIFKIQEQCLTFRHSFQSVSRSEYWKIVYKKRYGERVQVEEIFREFCKILSRLVWAKSEDQIKAFSLRPILKMYILRFLTSTTGMYILWIIY